MAELNLSLETKVDERTEQLGVLAQKEHSRSESLQFQQIKTETLNEITHRLERCDTLASGVKMIGQLIAPLCSPFSGCYSIEVAGKWQKTEWWGDEKDSQVIVKDLTIQTHFDDTQGTFVLNITNQQGAKHIVAVLQVWATQAPEHCPVSTFMQLIQRAIDKISGTLTNIALREELQRFSYEDVLTNLKNRRFFTEFLEHEISSSERNQEPLSLLMCDIDYFKKFNDRYGHPAGDQALRTLAGLLSDSFRQADIACRLGGEEFVVIMPMAKAEDCLRRAEQLMSAVESTVIEFNGEILENLTISVGIASWPELTSNANDLIQDADQALYEAKESGRSCIRLANSKS